MRVHTRLFNIRKSAANYKLNKAVIDRRKLLESSPVRPSISSKWYYCAQLTAKPKAVCVYCASAGRRRRATSACEQM